MMSAGKTLGESRQVQLQAQFDAEMCGLVGVDGAERSAGHVVQAEQFVLGCDWPRLKPPVEDWNDALRIQNRNPMKEGG